MRQCNRVITQTTYTWSCSNNTVLEKSEVFQTPVLQVRIRTIKDEKLWFAYRFRLNDQSKELERVIEHLELNIKMGVASAGWAGGGGGIPCRCW